MKGLLWSPKYQAKVEIVEFVLIFGGQSAGFSDEQKVAIFGRFDKIRNILSLGNILMDIFRGYSYPY